MTVYFDGLVIFQIFCLVQGITTGVFLLATQKKQPSRYWLGLLLLGLTCQVVDYFLSRSGVYYRNRWLYFSPLFFSWGFGPLLYFYVKALFQKKYSVNPWHFAPVVVQILFYLILSFQSLDTKAAFWIAVHKPYTRYLEYYGTCLSVFCYLTLSIRLLRTHHQPPRWLYRFLLGLIVFYGVAALDPIFNHWYLAPQAPKFYLTAQVLPAFIYWLALTSILIKPVAFIPKKTTVTVDKAKMQRIMKAMQEDQLYKNPDLSLPVLAQHVGLRTNEVSQLINGGLNKTFTDFVNDFRLTEVKTRLQNKDDELFTLLGIALEAGFRSKTTFNRVFKERTGMAPKNYKKNAHLIQRSDGAINRS